MPAPSVRYKILPARGDISALTAAVAEIAEGELCYALDEDKLYVKEGGALIPMGGDVTSVAGKTGDVTLVKADITDFSDADYATAAQGATADSATQPGDNVSTLANDAGYVTEAPQDGTQYVRNNAAWEAVDVPPGTIVGTSADLPGSVDAGQLWYDTDSGRLFAYTGTEWADASPDGGYATCTTSDTAPADASDGDLWYRTSDGRMYVYYDDGSTSQWVDANPNLPVGSDTFERSGTTVSLVNSGDTVSLDGDLTVDTNTLHVDSANNRVGIGTTSPLSVLDARQINTGGTTEIKLYNTDNTNALTQSAAISISPDSRASGARLRAIKENADFSTNGGRDVSLTFESVLNNAPTERMRIDSSGNVGIGTASPGFKLDVNGSIGVTEGQVVAWHDGSGNLAARIYGSSADELRFEVGSGASRATTIDSSGRLGIGTTSPGSIFEISKANGGDITITNPTNYGTVPGTSPSSRVSNGIVWRGNAETGFGSATTIVETNFIRSVLQNTTTGNSSVQGQYALTFGTSLGGNSASDAVERMRIDNSGKVGIGTSSPSYKLDVYQNTADFAARIQNDGSTGLGLKIGAGTGTAGDYILELADRDGNSKAAFGSDGNVELSGSVNAGNGNAAAPAFSFAGDPDGGMFRPAVNEIAFATLGTERMRVTNGGGVLVSTTTDAINSSSFGTRIGGASTAAGYFTTSRNVGTGGDVAIFYGQSGQLNIKGDGDCENTNNRYTGISDVKFKQNIEDASSQWDDIKAIQVRKYELIEHPEHKHIGVVAQELEQTCPKLVIERQDEATGESYKSVAYSVLYVKAVKALQEAMDRIETLEAEVAALKQA